MPDDLTNGYDSVIELSVEKLLDSFTTEIQQIKGTRIGDELQSVLGGLKLVLSTFQSACSANVVASFDIPSSLTGPFHPGLYYDNLYLKLSFQVPTLSLLGFALTVPDVEITVEIVAGIDVGPCIPDFSSNLQFLRLNLHDYLAYCHVTIGLDTNLIGSDTTLLNQCKALLNSLLTEWENVTKFTNETIDDDLKDSLQNTIQYIPFPLIPLIVESQSQNPLVITQADCRALTAKNQNNDRVLVYLLTFGGGAPGDRWGFDKNGFNSAIEPNNDFAIIFSLRPFICRLIKNSILTGLGLTGDDATAFSNNFTACNLLVPVVIDADQKVTLTAFTMQTYKPLSLCNTIPLPHGGFSISMTLTKSGFCYNATGSLSVVVIMGVDSNGNVIVSQVAPQHNVDSGLDPLCVAAAIATGAIVLADPVITAAVEASLYGVINSLCSTLSRDAIQPIANSLTAAINTVIKEQPLPELESALQGITVDDVALGYTLNLIKKVNLPTPILTSPINGSRLYAPENKATTTLTWQPVPGATGYKVEVSYAPWRDPDSPPTWANAFQGVASGNSLTFEFMVSQPAHARWRVTALDNSGRSWQSMPSPWSTFSWSPPLQTPTPVSPPDTQRFSNIPRSTTVAWQPVENASSYLVEVEYANSSDPADVKNVWSPVYKIEVSGLYSIFEFIGAQAGRWRVTALDNFLRFWSSNPSAWRTFVYTV